MPASLFVFANERLLLDLSAFALDQQLLKVLLGSVNTVPQPGAQPEQVGTSRIRKGQCR